MKKMTVKATRWSKSVTLTAAAVLLAGASISANAVTVTGNVGYVSDYLFRGISQTNEGMALQGGLNLNSDSGFYLSTWGSNIKFGDGSMELDVLAGWTGKVSNDWTLDVGVMQYRYPNGDNATTEFNFVEAYVKGTYKDFVFGYAYANDYFGAGVDQYHYLSVDHTYALPNDFSIVSHLGYNLFEDDEQFQTFLAAGPVSDSNYIDFSVGVAKSILGASVALKYAGTNVSDSAQCNLCDNRLVFSVSKSF